MEGDSIFHTSASNELKSLLNLYTKILPKWSFPYIPLVIAAFFQSFAWLSGPNLFKNYSLIPRMIIMWLLAGGEYLFMIPSMNAGVELLNLLEPYLVVIYQITTLVVFMFVDIFVFKKPFPIKYVFSFILLALAVLVTYL